MKVNTLYAVFFMISCGQSPDFFLRGSDENEKDSDDQLETGTEQDVDTDTDADTDIDTDMEDTFSNEWFDSDMDTNTVKDTDTNINTDTVFDTETSIDDNTDEDTQTVDDFVCESDRLDVTECNGCPFNLENQMYGHCVTEALWICALTDDIEVFAWNNFGDKWTLCELQGTDYICSSSTHHVCAQSIKFGLSCL